MKNGMSRFLEATKSKAQPSHYNKMGWPAAWTKHQHKIENEKWTKAYQAKGYCDIASFFQPKQDHPLWPSTHQSAVGVSLWAQEVGVAAAKEEEEEEEEEEGPIGLDTKHMVDMHTMDITADEPILDGYAQDRHTVDRDAPDRHMSGGYTLDRQAADRCTPDGPMSNGYALDGYAPDGYTVEGYTPDRHAADRHAGYGPMSDRHTPDGYAAEWYTTYGPMLGGHTV